MCLWQSAADTLGKFGIRTIGQLVECDKKGLASKLGKMGEMIHEYANSIDDSPVKFAHEPDEVKSIGNGMTFKRNLVGLDDINAGLLALSDKVATRLRKAGLKCSTVQGAIKDPQFNTISRQMKLAKPTQSSKEIRVAALDIIKRAWNLKAPIRMLTVTGTQLVDEHYPEQLSLFYEGDTKQREKMEKIEDAVDTICSRYGKSSSSFGSSTHKDIGIENYDTGDGE